MTFGFPVPENPGQIFCMISLEYLSKTGDVFSRNRLKDKPSSGSGNIDGQVISPLHYGKLSAKFENLSPHPPETSVQVTVISIDPPRE